MKQNKSKKSMKTSLAVLALATVMPLSAFAQGMMQKKVTINVKQANVENVLAQVKKQTGLNFFYSSDLAKSWPKVTVKVTNKSAQDAINQIASAIGCSYDVNENIVTFKQQALSGKQRLVEGVVVDDSGAPVVGAPICIGETRVCTITDADGKFSFKIPTEQTTLKISYLGMETEYVTISAGQQTVRRTVTLKSDNVLENVMVTGYQSISSGRSTGSFAVVKPEEMHTVVSNNFVDNLEGKVAGLSVDGQGNMIIRGQATIYAETKPLIVVDGFPMEYDSYTINPNDIEQISILKDAASASIWGVRAANGVIVITTKKGKNNQKTTVSYNGSLKVGSKFNTESLGYLNSAQQIEFEREYYANNDVISSYLTGSNRYSEAAEIEMKFKQGTLDAAGRDAAYAKLAGYNNMKDIEKEFYRNPFLQTHNISISGGSHISNNYLSLNFENSLQGLKGNDENRINLQFNNVTALCDKITLTSGVRGKYSNQNTYSGNPTSMMPYVHLLDENGNYVNEYKGVSQLWKDDLQKKGYGDWSYNRLKDRSEVEDNTKAYNVSANLALDFVLPLGFKFTTSGMFTVDHSTNEILNSRNSYYARDLFNRFTSIDAAGNLTNNLPEGAVKDNYEVNSTSYTWRNVLNYNFAAKDWDVSAMAGCELFAIRTKTGYDCYFGYDPQGLTFGHNLDFKTLTSTGVVGYDPSFGKMTLDYQPYVKDVEDRYFSTFGTASGTYKGKYTLFGSIRYDKTNLYGRSSKYRDQPTWSVGGKWDISRENFFHADFVDNLSLKASYGLSGNIDKTTSPYLIAKSASDMFSGLPCLIIGNPENLELGWEKVYTTNVGVSASMFNNRFHVGVDYYNRKTKDALGMAVLDPTTGWTSIKKNASSLVNRGLDVEISGSPVKTKDFTWNSSLIFSYNYNKVTEVSDNAGTMQSLFSHNPVEDRPVDYVWSIRTSKLTSEGELQVMNAKGEVGGYALASTFTLDDYVFNGRTTPPYFGAWTNSFSYKDFTLDFTLNYKFGHKMMAPDISNVYLGQRIYNSFDNRWRQAGDEEKTWIPRSMYGLQSGTYSMILGHVDHAVLDADIIRIKSIGLAYNFNNLLNSKVVKDLNLRFAVENPYFWVKNSEGLDSDRMISGSYLGDAPTYYTFTLNVTL